MAEKGLNVKELSEIKRLLNLGLTNREIARALKIHRNTINKYVEKIKNSFESDDKNKIPAASSHWSV